MAKPLLIETTKTGIEISSGKPKLIIIGNWHQVDEETGFISQSAINGVLNIIARKMMDMKFTTGKVEQQNIMVLGDNLIITQSPRSSGKLMNREHADSAARAIMEQYFKFATASGYFDEVDPTKLKDHVETPGQENPETIQ